MPNTRKRILIFRQMLDGPYTLIFLLQRFIRHCPHKMSFSRQYLQFILYQFIAEDILSKPEITINATHMGAKGMTRGITTLKGKSKQTFIIQEGSHAITNKFMLMPITRSLWHEIPLIILGEWLAKILIFNWLAIILRDCCYPAPGCFYFMT